MWSNTFTRSLDLSLTSLHAKYTGKKVDVIDLISPKHKDFSFHVRGLYYTGYK